MKTERRYLHQEVRAVQDGDTRKIRGYASVFNSLSLDLGGFKEKIDRHAFDACLDGNPDVVGLFNHDPNMVLGRTPSTLTLSVDDTGLAYSIVPPDTQLGRDLITSMDRNDIRSSSFGFYSLEDTWDIGEDDTLVRTILKAEVVDVSPVTFPAYPDATSEVRSWAAPETRTFSKETLTEIRSTITTKRDLSTDGDGEAVVDDGDDCMCECAACVAGDCDQCSADPCTAENCRCAQMRNWKRKAEIRLGLALRRRL